MSVGTRRAGEELPTEIQGDLVGRPEQALEQHRSLERPVKRMVGREADPGEHLLALGRNRARRAPRGRLRERRRDHARFVTRRAERRVKRFDRHERIGEPMTNGLERSNRPAELDPLQRVRAREGQHRPARAQDLVRDRAASEGDGRLPRVALQCLRIGRGVLHAHHVEAGIGIDAHHRARVRG